MAKIREANFETRYAPLPAGKVAAWRASVGLLAQWCAASVEQDGEVHRSVAQAGEVALFFPGTSSR